MFSTFLSVILIADLKTSANDLFYQVNNTYTQLSNQFRDLEIIIIHNGANYSLSNALENLPNAAKAIVHGLQLNKIITTDIAILAGFERANGDWAIALTASFAGQPELILELFERAQQNNSDLITLQPSNANLTVSVHKIWHYFYRFMGKDATPIPVTTNALLSRRALSSLSKQRQKPFDLPLAYTQTGFPITIMTATPSQNCNIYNFGRGWQRLLCATPFLRHIVITHSLLAFINFCLTLFGSGYFPSFYNNLPSEVIEKFNWQSIQFAWLWFMGSLILLGMNYLWQRWQQIPVSALYQINNTSRILLNMHKRP